ncbi:MAG: hypothetical protein PHE48_02025 [Candidatus Daviesbacteria bacterium]|nr:hypothetical protein [Candidatus Daviesbacteria bacterium]
MIYLKTIGLILILSICGFIIVRRICNDVRIQILLPTAVITGMALYVFLLNLVAYIIKGPSGFYVALAFEILLTYFLKVKIKPKEIIFPPKKEKAVWIISLLIWFIFLFQICATGNASSWDWLYHSILSSLFVRGDFPIHTPFQPDRLSSSHVGVPEILGSLRLFTGGTYTFLGSTISLITLFAISQILQWILKIKNSIFNLILLIFIPLTAIVSLGNFMIVWPYQFSFPQIGNGIISWLHNLPTLYSTYNSYGAPVSLDSLNLFLHRMFALSIFSALIPLALFPNKLKSFFSSAIILILLAGLALSDESVFIVTTPVIILILFFTLFKKNIKFWILFCMITLGIIVFQGGLVNEVIFKSNTTIAKVLLFPDDNKDPAARFEKYRSYRLEAQSSKMIPEKKEYSPFRWFHFGAIWQVSALFIACFVFTIIFKNKLTDKSPLYLTWLFCLSGLIALVAFHGIVPEGWTHINGNRFLSLSYQLSGIGIMIFIILGWINLKATNSFSKYYSVAIKIFLAWFVITSILPTLAILFPRQKQNWFKTVIDSPKAEQVWIKDNLKVDIRILPFMEKFPTSGSVLEVINNVGIFTPVWYEEPAAQGFDVSPPYLDLFFTQNPEILKILKVDYIMTNKSYRSILPAKRLADLNNLEYFKTVYSDKEGDVIISKILPDYLLKAENYKGTFYELSQILPAKGAFFIEQPSGIVEGVWRVAFLTLQMHNYQMYYSLKFIPVYNFIINVHLKFNGESNNRYDYLVLGPKTDPQSIVKTQTTLVWSQIAGYLNVWKVN